MFAHFLTAQDEVYPRVLAELTAGAKRTHWIWFIFPQLTALGRSLTARQFGLENLDEAKAYAAHDVLGARLRECVALVNAVEGRTALEVMGPPDDLKLRSSVTLFGRATGEPLFAATLAKYYDGKEDTLTLDLLGLK